MPTYCLTVAYDGTDFVGWQRQQNGPSVQAALEAALAHLFEHPVSCRGAGRTDAGVHASGQVISFRSERILPIRALIYGTNNYLPPSIAVRAARIAPDDFDARFSASGKLYRYRIFNAEVRSPLYARTHWYIYASPGKYLDLSAMRDAAATLVGRHDFRAFRAADCARRTTVRLIRRLEVYRPHSDESMLYIDVEATAFLKQMVRILTGTLVEVGRGRKTVADVAALLESGDRSQAGPTAPGHGLELCRVDYDPKEDSSEMARNSSQGQRQVNGSPS